MVSLVNSHSNATRIRWHLWEIDLRFALCYLQGGWVSTASSVHLTTVPSRPSFKEQSESGGSSLSDDDSEHTPRRHVKAPKKVIKKFKVAPAPLSARSTNRPGVELKADILLTFRACYLSQAAKGRPPLGGAICLNVVSRGGQRICTTDPSCQLAESL